MSKSNEAENAQLRREIAEKNVKLAEQALKIVQIEQKLLEKGQKLAEQEQNDRKLITATSSAESGEQSKRVNSWDTEACDQNLAISNNGLCVEVSPKDLCGGTVRAKFPLKNSQELPMAYFEVEIVKLTKIAIIGLIKGDFPLDENEMIGDFVGSYGFDSGGDFSFSCKEKEFGPVFGEKDTVGCGFMPNGQLFFTLNGKMIAGKAVLPKVDVGIEFFPAVTLLGKDTKVEANFGDDPAKPVLFKLDTLMSPKNETDNNCEVM